MPAVSMTVNGKAVTVIETAGMTLLLKFRV